MADDPLQRFRNMMGRGEEGGLGEMPVAPAPSFSLGGGDTPFASPLERFRQLAPQNRVPDTLPSGDVLDPTIVRQDPRFEEAREIILSQEQFRGRSPFHPLLDALSLKRDRQQGVYGEILHQLSEQWGFSESEINDQVMRSLGEERGRDWLERLGNFTEPWRRGARDIQQSVAETPLPGQSNITGEGRTLGSAALGTTMELTELPIWGQEMLFALTDDVFDVGANAEVDFRDTWNALKDLPQVLNPLGDPDAERVPFEQIARRTGEAFTRLGNAAIETAGGEPTLDPDTLFGDEQTTEDVYDYLGIAGDLFVAPDMFGMWARLGGKTLRTAGRVAAGDRLVALGNTIDALPGMSIGSSYRSLPEGARRATEDFLSTRLINPLLNSRIPGLRYATGEYITPFGRNPIRPGLGATEGGAGLSQGVVEAQRQGALLRERTLSSVNNSYEAIQGALGERVARGWVDSMLQTGRRYGRRADRYVGKYELPMQQTMLALAGDVVDSVGVLQRPGAIQQLDNVFTYTEDASVVAPTVGQEYANLRTAFEQQAAEDLSRLNRAGRGSSAGMFRSLQQNPAFEVGEVTDNGRSITLTRNGAAITLTRNADGTVSTDSLTRGGAGTGSELKRLVLDAADEHGVTMTASNAPTPRAGETSEAFDFEARREANAQRLQGEGYVLQDDGTFVRNPAAPEIRGTPLTDSLVERETRERLRQLAVDNGLDPDEVLRDFDELVDVTIAADVEMGFRQSLYVPVKQAFFQEVMAKGGDLETAQTLWRRMYQEANFQTPRQQRGLLPDQEPEVPAIYQIDEVNGRPLSEVFGEGVSTTGDLFDGTRLATNLDLSTFMQANGQGHLRRIYGFFQHDRDFQRYVNLYREGRVMPGQLMLDTTDAKGNVQRGGINRARDRLVNEGWNEGVADNFARAAREYVDQIAPAMTDSRGVIIRYDALAQHLGKRFTPEQVADGLNALVEGMRPELAQRAQRLQEYGEVLQQRDELWDRPFQPASTVAERANMTVEQLEELGQLGDIRAQLLEQLRPSTTAIERANMLAGIYRYAKKAGLVYEGSRPPAGRASEFVPMDNTQLARAAYGPFASRGKQKVWVDRTLQRQLRSMVTADPQTRATWLQHLMSNVRAGFLAHPRVTNVNFGGGFFQGAMLGINPFELATSWGRAVREWRERGDDLEALRDLGDIVQTGAAHHAIVRNIDTSKLDAIGLGQRGGIRDVITDISRIYREALDAPLGKLRNNEGVARAFNRVSSYLGLEGFQTSEVSMKLAGYYWARAHPDEAVKIAQRFGLRNPTPETAAREIARQIVFDYSSAPKLVDMLRNTGIVAFPGFSYFLIPRMLDAYINRPGVMRVAENLDEAIWEAHFAAGEDEEDLKLLLYEGMPEYLREGRAIPVARGEDSVYASSLDWLPTRWNSTIVGGLMTGGIESSLWMPLVDLAASPARQGEALAGQQYGRRVFDPEATAAQKLRQAAGFFHNAYAPSLLRDLIAPASDPSEPLAGPEGLLPALYDSVTRVPPSVAGTGLTVSEFMSGNPDRQLWLEAAAMLIRNPREVSIDPLLDDLNQRYSIEEREIEESLARMDERYTAYLLMSRSEELSEEERQRAREQAEYWQQRATELDAKFLEDWMPIHRALARYYSTRSRQQREQQGQPQQEGQGSGTVFDSP